MNKKQHMEAIYQAIAIYDNSKKMGDVVVFMPPKPQWVHKLNYDGAYYFDGKVLTIFDRGTDTLADWGKDFNFVHFEIPSGDNKNPYEIHSGLLEWHLQRREWMFKLIDTCHPETVHFLGHSAGGGTAVIGGFDVKIKYPNIKVIVHAFDAPNPLDKYATKKYNEIIDESYIFWLEGEPVHDVPPEFMDYGRVKGGREFKPVEWWSWMQNILPINIISAKFIPKAHPHHPMRLALSMNKYLEV